MKRHPPALKLPGTLSKLSLRDLLWLMVVVALGAAWFSSHRAALDAQARFRGLQAEYKSFLNASRAPSTPPPIPATVRERATAVAQAYLQETFQQGSVDDWGEPIGIRAGHGEDIILEYKTPSKELELLGSRTVRVHADNWTAAFVGRD